MSTEWTLEAELQKITGALTLGDSLVSLGLLPRQTTKFSIRRDARWQRGGAETFVYRFWVDPEGRSGEGYILKACVPFSPGLDIKEVLASWIKRRHLLASHGLQTPRLVAKSSSLLIEELVPHTLCSVFYKNKELPQGMLLELAKLAAIYSALGFSPVDGFGDLRSHGDDIVVIDFGEDLGPPHVSTSGISRMFDALLSQIAKWELRIGTQLLSEMQAAYEETRESTRSSLSLTRNVSPSDGERNDWY